MSYQALISNNVRKVFNLVKDLADIATLNKKENVKFDFSTGEVKGTISTLTTKIVITDVESNLRESVSNKKIGLLKTQEIGDISNYDTLTSNNKTWKIGPIIRTDRFVTIVELYE